MSEPTAVQTITTQMINLNGVRLFVATRQGDRSQPPLLLINGLGANIEMFDPFLEALAQDEGCPIGTIRFDVPGVGGSPTLLFPLGFRQLARLITQMLDYFDYEMVDVLGISWGGALAQQFARQYPWRCRRLILVATSTGAVSLPGRPSVIAKLMSPLRYYRPSYLRKIAPTIYGGVFRDQPELIKEHARLARAPGGLGYYWQLMAGVGWTSIHWLHRLQQPTLILAGDDDPLIPLSNAKIMNRLIPDSTLYIVIGGHLFLLVQTETIVPIIHQFLTGDR